MTGIDGLAGVKKIAENLWEIDPDSKVGDWVRSRALQILLLDEPLPKHLHGEKSGGKIGEEGVYYINIRGEDIAVEVDGDTLKEKQVA